MNRGDAPKILGGTSQEIPANPVRKIEVIYVPKSNVSRIGYDHDTQVLQVTFANGGSYTKSGVSEETLSVFRDAESKGKFYNANLRGDDVRKMDASEEVWS